MNEKVLDDDDGVVVDYEPMRTKEYEFKCVKCKHEWRSRLKNGPMRCVNVLCQTPYWRKQKQKEKKESVNAT